MGYSRLLLTTSNQKYYFCPPRARTWSSKERTKKPAKSMQAYSGLVTESRKKTVRRRTTYEKIKHSQCCWPCCCLLLLLGNVRRRTDSRVSHRAACDGSAFGARVLFLQATAERCLMERDEWLQVQVTHGLRTVNNSIDLRQLSRQEGFLEFTPFDSLAEISARPPLALSLSPSRTLSVLASAWTTEGVLGG